MRDMSESPNTRVVRAVAEATDTDPLDLPPLYESVDPGALDALSASEGGGTGAKGVGPELQFFYAGQVVRFEDGPSPSACRKAHRGRPGSSDAGPPDVLQNAQLPLASVSGRERIPARSL